jgi:hypothetical protein
VPRIKVIGEDRMCFWVDAKTLEPERASYFDPWVFSDPEDVPTMHVNEWKKRRYDRWLNETRFRAAAQAAQGKNLKETTMSAASLAHASKPKHRARAVQAMALHICCTDKTDGFCSPLDGSCSNPLGGKPERRLNCMDAAEQLMRAMETRGLMVVWPYDKD